MEGFQLSKQVTSELKKRIGSAGTKGGKAKLNLYNCGINDRRAILLVEILAMRPIISKVDLNGNDISDEVCNTDSYIKCTVHIAQYRCS